MIQLIIGGVQMPFTSKDRYKCVPTELGETLEMIDGSMRTEVRGVVRVIEYSYDYLDPATYAAVLAVVRSNTAFEVTYLPDDSSTMKTARFLCTKKPTPTLAFQRNGTAYWHNFAITLREECPA